MAVCYYDGILRSEEEDAIYIGDERRIVLVDGDVTFDRFLESDKNC